VDLRERCLAERHVVVDDNILPGSFDGVVVPLPPDRDLARRWILTAWDALVPGGTLLLAGANAEGAKSLIADATVVFGAARAAYPKRKHRIARFRRPEASPKMPAWAREPGLAPGTWAAFEVETGRGSFLVETQSGVFAGNRLDAGTRLLLERLDVPTGGRALDVGCGVGVIGIAAHIAGAAQVDLVDVNLLAVEAARRNLGRLGVPGRAWASDVFSAVSGERYDVILSNPPFHRGKSVDLSVADRLIADAPGHLVPGGRLLIVANAFLAYGKQMERVFRTVETVASTPQYHLLEASDPR
jgi:16S rRNA (guanine1207-N2)-methyltransferase